MDPKKLLKILAFLLAAFVLLAGILPAFGIELSDDPFVLIPEADDGSMSDFFSEDLGKTKDGGDFWAEYNTNADVLGSEENGIGAQLKSGILSWDFILGFLKQLVRFIANMALIVGSISIIYAGYLYATSAITGTTEGASKAQNAIKYAAIGITLVIFSYAIINILVQAFL